MQGHIFGILLVIGVCWAEVQIPNDPAKLDEIPAIKERCQQKGKPDTYDRIKVAINETRDCLQSKINPEQIKNELEEAKKTGSMDEVFGKYCNRRPEYKECILKTVNVSKECLEESEVNALDTAIRLIEEVADFACFRDGDRLAMFVAEGGNECVSNRTEQIKDCLNATLKIDTGSFTLASLPKSIPSLRIDKKKCDDFAKIQDCVVSDLENHCKDTTPANIVDALFKFVKKSICKNLKQKRSLNLWRTKRDIDFDAIKMINSSIFNQKFAEECNKNGGEGAYDEFRSSMSAAQTCFEKNRIFVTPKNEYLHSIGNCTKDHITTVENCLTAELKFYPKFIVEIIESLVECAYDHLNLHELTPKSEIVFCLQRIKSAGGIQKNLSACTQGIIPNEISAHNSSLPNKTRICKSWRDLDDCFNKFIKTTCAPDIAVDRVLGNLTRAIQKPCRENQ